MKKLLSLALLVSTIALTIQAETRLTPYQQARNTINKQLTTLNTIAPTSENLSTARLLTQDALKSIRNLLTTPASTNAQKVITAQTIKTLVSDTTTKIQALLPRYGSTSFEYQLKLTNMLKTAQIAAMAALNGMFIN